MSFQVNMLKYFFFTILALLISSCSSHEPEVVEYGHNPQFVKRGEHLANGMALCAFCHGSTGEPFSELSGGKTVYDRFGAVQASNITPSDTGIDGWSETDIVRSIRAGRGADDRQLSMDVHSGYEWMSDTDAFSIAAYVSSVPPVPNEVPRRSISLLGRYTRGLFDKQREVTGHIPAIPKRFKVEYGKYLVDHVARCTYCHNSPGGIFSAGDYLRGGAWIRSGELERRAPGIASLQDWSEEALVHYLKTSELPDESVSDPEFCPTSFYANAGDEALNAVAAYLIALPEAE